jgi:oxygen-dependent protoporphyrinogen oxidase
VDAIVVRGGIAGLARAWMLRHRDVLLLEADTRVGGRIWSEARGTYWLNWGAHVFAGPESATGRLMQEVGVHAEPVPGELAGLAMNGRLLTDGRVETYPFRVPMACVTCCGAASRAQGAASGPQMRRQMAGSPRCEAAAACHDFLGDQTFQKFTRLLRRMPTPCSAERGALGGRP